MREWLKALLVAAAMAWFLMAGLDLIETQLRIAKQIQLDLDHRAYEIKKILER